MKDVRPIFKDSILQKKFDEEGYVKIRLMSAKDVDQLRELFKIYFPNPSVDFFSSSYENDHARKKEMSDAMGKVLLPNLDNFFTDFTWFGSAFLSKGNGPRSEMPMHQDWSIVDETKYVALNIWTPLQDTTEENGTLEVLPGSHLWHQSVRAPTLPFYFEGFQHLLQKRMLAIPTAPAEAIILNQAIIHYSKPNVTPDLRVAITTGIKSKGAPMLFHYWNKDAPDVIEQFREEDDFLIRFSDFHQAIFKRPVLGESLGMRAFKLAVPSMDELNKLIGNTDGFSVKKSMGQKLTQWLKG